jgi:hypothetical protein
MIPKKKKAATKKATSKPKAVKDTVTKVEEVKEEEYIPKKILIRFWKFGPNNYTDEPNKWIDIDKGLVYWSDIKQKIVNEGGTSQVDHFLKNNLQLGNGKSVSIEHSPREWVTSASQGIFPDRYYVTDVSETVDEA